MAAQARQLAAVASVQAGADGEVPPDSVVVRSLSFSFPFSSGPVIHDLSLALPRGSRCLLTGANGAGEAPAARVRPCIVPAAAVPAGPPNSCLLPCPLPPAPLGRPAGKTSLLQVLAGKYMVGQDDVRILGRPAFHDIGARARG